MEYKGSLNEDLITGGLVEDIFMMTFWRHVALAATAGWLLTHVAEAAPPPGKATLESSKHATAQAPFLRGHALLHNFEYQRAAQAFREAQAVAGGSAMAYWGETMTHNHPIRMEQDSQVARAVLTRLGATAAERASRAANEPERAYPEAIEALYRKDSKEERDRAYSERMAWLAAHLPDDVDAQAFYALSSRGLAPKGRDYGLYIRSATLLEELDPANVRHPGVLHYLIHFYDDPTHAPLGRVRPAVMRTSHLTHRMRCT